MQKPGDTFKCYLVSWDEAYRLSKILARKIKSSGFKPDLVIGIARGGLVPARIVCDFLLQKDLAAIKVEHWGIAATLGKARIKFPLPIDISGKKILVVDDVADTGDTFSVIMDYIKEKTHRKLKPPCCITRPVQPASLITGQKSRMSGSGLYIPGLFTRI